MDGPLNYKRLTIKVRSCLPRSEPFVVRARPSEAPFSATLQISFEEST
jgi:hypothetical protein